MDVEALLVASSIWARTFLGGVLLWAGIAKFRQLAVFQRTLTGYGLLPRLVVTFATRAIPSTEVGLGILLILGLGTRWVVIVTLLLLGTFTLASANALIRGHRVNCSCFGNDGAEMGWSILKRNVGLMLLGCGAATFQPSAIGLDRLLYRDHASTVRLDQALIAVVLWSAVVVIWLLIGESLKYRRHMWSG